MADFAYSNLLTYFTSDGSLASSSSGSGVQSSPDTDDGFYDVGDDLNSVAGYVYVGSFTNNGHEFLVFDRLPGDRTLLLSATAAESDFPATYQNGDFSLDTSAYAVCFAAGTLISTEKGETPVEQLQIGERVRSHDGSLVRVKWIGRQTVSTRFGPAERLMPVRFAAGSLGDGLPHSDLTVTADHGMLVDGVICHAGALVNGTTITRVPLSEMGETYTVYHIETEEHEIIFANGAPAETFIDNVSRRAFGNFAEFETLYGDVPEMEELPYPRAMSARQVPGRIVAKLARKAVA